MNLGVILVGLQSEAFLQLAHPPPQHLVEVTPELGAEASHRRLSDMEFHPSEWFHGVVQQQGQLWGGVPGGFGGARRTEQSLDHYTLTSILPAPLVTGQSNGNSWVWGHLLPPRV